MRELLQSPLRSRAWSAGELGQVGGRGKEPRATIQRPWLWRLTGGGLGGRNIHSGRPGLGYRVVLEQEAWGRAVVPSSVGGGPVVLERYSSFSARAGGPAWVAPVSGDEAAGHSPLDLQGSPMGQPGAGAQPEVEDASPPAAPHRIAPRPHRLRALEPRGRYRSLGVSRSPPPPGSQSSHRPLPLGTLSLCPWAPGPLCQSVTGKQKEPRDMVRQKDSLSGAPSGR